MGKVKPLHRVNGQGQADCIGVDMKETTQTALELDLPENPQAVRTCRDCGKELPLTAYTRNRFRSDGYQPLCIDCMTALQRRARGVAPEASYLRPSPTDLCGICNGEGDGRGLFLDHDHMSGHFRGWLCHHCNAGIGHFDDDPERLRSAIRYLTAEVEVNLNP